ncbi:MAG TPA: GTP-binding protein LepA [Pricia sp.]|nr:GTP-binding protein LepA [Pricia sp.]
MTTYIAHFTAKHRIIQVEQHSIFIWQQESGEIDESLLSDKIKRESSIHFFQLISEDDLNVAQEDVYVKLLKAIPFTG